MRAKQRPGGVGLFLSIALVGLLAGCTSVPATPCAKHRCDPSIDEQFKRNASWDAHTPDEYDKLPAKH